MSEMKVFLLDQNGAGWVSAETLSVGDEIEMEMALAFGEIQNACHICLIPIGKGNACHTHRNNKGSIYLP